MNNCWIRLGIFIFVISHDCLNVTGKIAQEVTIGSYLRIAKTKFF